MSKQKVYLAGPIHNCTDRECKDWRSYVTLAIQDWGYEILDPLKRDYRGVEAKNTNSIIEQDKEDISKADIIVANCFTPSYGTAMEIFYAHSLGKRILVVTESNSPWLIYHANLIVKTVKDVVKILVKI